MKITIERNGKIYSAPTYIIDRRLKQISINLEDLEEIQEKTEEEGPDFPEPIKFPQDLHDLDKIEHKETCERLISLIIR